MQSIGNEFYCSLCYKRHIENREDRAFFQDARDFKPLDSLVNISELTEVLNEPIFEVMPKKGS